MLLHDFILNLILVLHFLWILFLIFGVVFALKRSMIAWFHLGGLLFSLFINLFDFFCPLTYLENYLRITSADSRAYSGSFIARNLEPLIYPDVSEMAIRVIEILFVCVNLIVYGVLAKRYFLSSRPGRRVCSHPDVEHQGNGH
jgi:hypothetical protein